MTRPLKEMFERSAGTLLADAAGAAGLAALLVAFLSLGAMPSPF